MKLHTLIRALPFAHLPKENPEISGLAQDNRLVTENSLFICIKGWTVDGHEFAKDAVARGAAAVLAEKPMELGVPVIVVKDTKRAMAILSDVFYGQPSRQLHMVGITGTNGKTTTSHIIEKIYRDAGRCTGLIGTMYMKIGDETFKTKNTTPDSLTLQKTFHEMVEKHVTDCVMEVSSHALIQGRVHGCDYDIAVFTNLTQDHLDYHKTMAEYRRAKSLLFSQLGNSYNQNKPKYAVLNADDPASKEFEQVTAAPVVTYGIDAPADFMAKNIDMHAHGTTFTLVTPYEEQEVNLQLVGKFSVYNVLAAVAAGCISNVPLSSIVKSVEEMEGVRGRFELVKGGQDFTVIVDYAHTPDSLENVLKTVQQFAKKKIFVVVGCGGDRDKTKRPVMAKIACQYATDAIFTSDNPRSEDPLEILREMEAGVKGLAYDVIPDRREAIKTAVSRAQKGDVVIIAGKGHETYQIIGSEVHDFDDRKVALDMIKER
ncbi:UDP-N-acetylmuramoyl-L-alanyl-D-glutamate--2,6-diaminopimelate ligase [Heyndrickxia acidiproducens]|uniref:UDP-N-acetylmuramoyl-L-alanyl-D-glutamate--2, 6-diaminopimelate ligase n=1 Tax=Heyndrickxia acidiproducens TaxID=1121084 RepID=UPI00036F2509|nr:UDP-N-acetylmuramoyl-L-alanyl-D-glutamate--2,6-diaminopimelate ligase [Heyndrickxia acidiproducens]